MPAHKKTVFTVLQEWVERAENDLTAAKQILKLGKNAPMETIAFHAQQCVEKFIKAVLVHLAIPAKTHSLQILMKLFPRGQRPRLKVSEQRRLTNYAASARYPEAGFEISLADARKSVAIARRVRGDARRLLPKTALPPGKR